MRRQRAGRAHLTVAVSLAAAHLAFVPASAHAADPAGCTRDGTHITCTNGVPKGQTVTGTSGDDTIEVTGTVHGTIDGGDGNDTITVHGRNGAPGSNTSGRRADADNGGDGENAVGSGGTVLGGAGNDIITLIGGNGGKGGTSFARFGKGGYGGLGGDSVEAGVVDGGRGINLITLRGGAGGIGGAASNGKPGDGATGGRGLDAGRVIVGADQHSSLTIDGGTGGDAAPGGRDSGDGGVAVWRGVMEGGTAPEGVSIDITGGDSGRGSGEGWGGVGFFIGELMGTPGGDDITLEGGKSRSSRAKGRAFVSGPLDTKGGDDTITVRGGVTASTQCGPGNDTYNYTEQRGIPNRRTCEHINRFR
ncbi:hypothetical protein GCM10009544_32070 [Streptomyces stramineus]|uniref:Calcium-binding protein n=1 Tax=Streptomyces stramineus TaxID=173861 RepID=A0ABN1A4L0_9ACTN